MNDVPEKNAVILHVVDNFKAVINWGEAETVKKGDVFLVFGLGPELFDPESGESLGRLELVRGRAIVTHVQPRMATLDSSEFEQVAGARRIIRPDGAAAIAIAMGLAGRREEIEESPRKEKKPLFAEVGDRARLIQKA